MSFFFFQAEDGIRDWSVTGVQTCALPISSAGPRARTNSPDRTPDQRHRTRAGKRDQSGRDAAEREIGRASCGERVEISGGGGAVKKKKKEERRRRGRRSEEESDEAEGVRG